MKEEYTEAFDKWWSVYPRKTAKRVAFKAWIKQGIEGDAFLPKQIVQDTEKRTRLKWWSHDRSKIPHGATWINQARWEDEGWEDEIKTRGQEQVGASYSPLPPYIESPTHDNGDWMNMLNRVMVSYLLKAGGFSDAMLQALVKEKNAIHKELLPVAIEEIDMAKNKVASKVEMAFMFADTMLSRFDSLCGRTLKHQVINMDRKPA